MKSMYGNKYYSAVPAISEDGILVSDPKKKPIFLISILRVKLVFLIQTLLKFHFCSAARRISLPFITVDEDQVCNLLSSVLPRRVAGMA